MPACVAARHQQYLAVVLAPLHRNLMISSLQSMPTIDSCANWLPVLPNQCTCVVTELNHHAIFSLYLLLCADYDCVPNVSSLHLVRCRAKRVAGTAVAPGAGILDDDYDTITLGACVRVAEVYFLYTIYMSPHRLCHASSFAGFVHIRQL